MVLHMSDSFESKSEDLPQELNQKKSSLENKNSAEPEEGPGSESIRLELKDYIAITIAAFQTVLAPILLFIIAILIISMFLNGFR